MDTADIIATIKRTLDDDDLTCSEMVARIRTALRDTAIHDCQCITWKRGHKRTNEQTEI